MTKKSNKLFFPALTGYRAIAAWMIFIYHFFPFNNAKFPEWVKSPVFEFHIGVDMFFVLSGFLITYRYFNQTPINFKKYMVNRFARIYPMYFLITIGVFLVWFIQNGYWDSSKTYEALFSFTMTKALFTEFNLKGIPQGWTLTLEELFYITAPIYFLLIRKSINWLYALPFLILAIGIGLKAVFNTSWNEWGFLQTKVHCYIIEFFAGIGLGYFIVKSKFGKVSKVNWVTYFGLFITFVYLLTRNYFASVFNLKSDVGRFVEMGVLSILGIVPLLWGLINEKTLISSILSNKWMVLLGKSSYIFYLIHKGFIPIFINDYISDNKLVLFILLNVISIVMFTYIEEPLNHYIRRKFGKANP